MVFRKVKLIENAPFILPFRVELLLVYANQKPASEIVYYHFQNFNPSIRCYEITEPEITTLCSTLNKIGISHRLGSSEIWVRDVGFTMKDLFLEEQQKLLERMGIPYHNNYSDQELSARIFLGKKTLSKEDLAYAPPNMSFFERVPIFIGRDNCWLERIICSYNHNDNYERGICNGFPETAVQAYVGERSLFEGSFHDGAPLGFFSFFRHSAEYYEEEQASTVRNWHDTVKKLSPKIYAEISVWEQKVYDKNFGRTAK